MAISPLDLKTALVIIDLQKGIVSYPTVHPIDDVVKHASELAAAFRRHHLPVVLVNVAGGPPGRTERPHGAAPRASDWVELVPELNRQAQDHLVTKNTWGAFTNTNLYAHLKELGVTQIVLAGHVALAVDAMTDLDLDAHNHSVTRIFPRLGENGTSHEILDLLKKRFELR
jgi:nicotinamidase-related amidase